MTNKKEQKNTKETAVITERKPRKLKSLAIFEHDRRWQSGISDVYSKYLFYDTKTKYDVECVVLFHKPGQLVIRINIYKSWDCFQKRAAILYQLIFILLRNDVCGNIG